MASIFNRNDMLYISYTDEKGLRKQKSLKLKENTKNRKIAEEIKKEIEVNIENSGKSFLTKNNKIETSELKQDPNALKSLFYSGDLQQNGYTQIISLQEAIGLYKSSHIINTSLSNQRLYRLSINYLLKVVSVKQDIRSITISDIAEVIGLLRKEVSNATMHTYLTYIKSLFNFLVEEEYLTKSPVRKKSIPPRLLKNVEVYTLDVQEKIFTEALRRRMDYYQYLKMLRLTGQRPIDVLNLKNTDFVLNTAFPYVNIKIMKRSREVNFPLYEELYDFVKENFSDILNDPTQKRLFGKLSINAVNTMFKRVKKKLKLTEKWKYCLKTFRKTLASDLAARGMDSRDIAYLLGHTSAHTTNKYYTNTKSSDVGRKLNTFLNNNS
ncbi:MAG TPA: tyrosine-type recombinase/integrase [Bacillales bacterium]|nr:tyrosine-type recombinase/integrase [Bacillales bacterium]